jgi:hypothetical protein
MAETSLDASSVAAPEAPNPVVENSPALQQPAQAPELQNGGFPVQQLQQSFMMWGGGPSMLQPAMPSLLQFSMPTAVPCQMPSMMQAPVGSVLHPSGFYGAPALTLLEQLTQGMDNDSTQPSTATVKVTKPLEPDGTNLSAWMFDAINCSVTKNCAEAFRKPLPGTKANAAAMSILISSTPDDFHTEITAFPSAYEALLWICRKYQGGFDMSINEEWLRRLKEEGNDQRGNSDKLRSEEGEPVPELTGKPSSYASWLPCPMHY